MSWENWSGSINFIPSQIAYPKNASEVAELVLIALKYKSKIRAVGSSHSFSPLIETNHILMNLDKMQGVTGIEKKYKDGIVVSGQSLILGGTKLKTLGEMLHLNQLAMENLGDIDCQSIAGAISTGTHGTGTRFGNLSTQIAELTIVNGLGETIVCSEEKNRDIFKAAQVSLGSLGIIIQVKLNLLPSYRLKFTQKKENLDLCLKNINSYNETNRNFEFYYFPYSETTQCKFINTTDEEIVENKIRSWVNDYVVENGLFKCLSEVCRLFPYLAETISRISAWGVSSSEKINWSNKIYASPRYVKFNEMEYNIPREQFQDTMLEIKGEIEHSKHKVHFPIEARFVKKDDIWLSPAYDRDSAYIAVHMYKGMEYKKYFSAMESIFKNHSGRPHWGKMNNMGNKDLNALYPRYNDFLRVRKDMDPSGIFLNSYLRKIFNL